MMETSSFELGPSALGAVGCWSVKVKSNRAFRCIVQANLGRCCYQKAVLAFCYGYQPCELAVGLLVSRREPSLDCVASTMWYRCARLI